MAKAIMIQGTMSNVGKSLIAAGLCRIFHEDGLAAAPFKSQNMALNSYITKEGLEMGRAQVMQAEAAGIEPSVLMNPILLKPVNDTGSQVIVGGEVLGNYSAREYFAFKKQLVPKIMEAYHTLASQFDVIVIEGAGSPAEINLKQDDIVNMGMAKLARAPILLVGDIDRGGVFAQLAGTIQLVDPDERDMVKGLIINKFRGDPSILTPGISMLEDIVRIPVTGVIPYIPLQLDDEDSLSGRFEGKRITEAIDIAVVRLPRISNFTDFNPFEAMEGVGLRYAGRPDQLEGADLIIIPGTKNTMGDLKWLRSSGMEAAIRKAAGAGTFVFGICGGFQMLGENLYDPEGVEEGGSMRGMGLLPADTYFAKEKTRTQAGGTFAELDGALAALTGVPAEGYEIHMGRTVPREDTDVKICSALCLETETGSRREKKQDGLAAGNVMGSYVHGLFDRSESAAAVVRMLAEKKGLDPGQISGMDYAAFKETQYDQLSQTLRRHMDMEQVYRILEEGI